MRFARRASCGALALLMALPAGFLLTHQSRSGLPGTHAAAAATITGITVSLLPASAPLTELDAAQQPAANSVLLTDQTSKGGADLLPPAARQESPVGTREREAFLPVSQLTEWPRPLADARPPPGDDDGAADEPAPAAGDGPIRLIAVVMIDERGKVDDVQLDEHALVPALRPWLERRLRALRFAPGRLFGRPVRSRLAVELVLQ